MKKRLVSLLVALCMAVTLLPVSAITAWAEESGSNSKPLQFRQGYPILDGIDSTTDTNGNKIYIGDGWSYDETNKVLTIAPENPTTYDLTAYGSIRLDQNSILCSTVIGKNATIINGDFYDSDNPDVKIINHGVINSGGYHTAVTNHGTIIDGFFSSVVSNESDGTIENGTFTATVNNSGTINGGLFKIKPTGGLTSPGYTLNVIPPNSIRAVSINYIKNPCYIIPNSDSMFPTNVKVLFWSLRTPFSIGITFDNAQMQLEEWAQNIACYCDADGFFVTFSAPPTNTDTITLGKYDPKPVDPKPEPEPKPEPKPEPEVSTYTLTVKGGTFTYNGGEAITSASVPVDAAVKVTLNQSAVPEGMVFDLWAISDEGLLGNPAVAYNEESFIIPADSATKGSTVTVEAQYRDATIESEPGILGTAAIIGVAGAGTAVLAWQGYRIGMELYEKYFQQEQEEPPVEISTLEGQMTNLLS